MEFLNRLFLIFNNNIKGITIILVEKINGILVSSIKYISNKLKIYQVSFAKLNLATLRRCIYF